MTRRDQAQASAGLFGSATIIRILNAGIDLLFPPRCAGCGRVDARWCFQCQRDLDSLAINLLRPRLPPLLGSAATGVHEGKLQQAVHALKYNATQELAAPLGERLIAAARTLNWSFDMIAPVPLHTSRQKERGYNQSQLLGAYMAQVLGIPCYPSSLLRWRNTPPQVGLNREQRQANVYGAFRADPALVANQRVLLLDDVYTTGATLQDCARAALEAGANAVYSLTVTAARS